MTQVSRRASCQLLDTLQKQPPDSVSSAKLPSSLLLHLSSPCYHQMQCTVLGNSLDADGIAQLAAAHWPVLGSPNVSNIDMDSAAVAQLAPGSWPLLEMLDVSLNKLDTAAISRLAKGAWPKLHTLMLSGPTVSDSAAPGALEAANQWPKLEQIHLNCTKLSSDADA